MVAFPKDSQAIYLFEFISRPNGIIGARFLVYTALPNSRNCFYQMAFDLLTPAFAEEGAAALPMYILRGTVEALRTPLYEISWENHLF